MTSVENCKYSYIIDCNFIKNKVNKAEGALLIYASGQAGYSDLVTIIKSQFIDN